MTMMKRLTALTALAALLLVPLDALARQGQRGYSEQCFEDTYHEEYEPGTRERPGRVRRWTEQVEVACGPDGRGLPDGGVVRTRPYRGHPVPSDDNSCVEGSILGGILGGAAGGAAARHSTEGDMIWTIPLGVVTGSLIGCQIDGG